ASVHLAAADDVDGERDGVGTGRPGGARVLVAVQLDGAELAGSGVGAGAAPVGEDVARVGGLEDGQRGFGERGPRAVRGAGAVAAVDIGPGRSALGCGDIAGARGRRIVVGD